ncbi:MAG: hypothetical protein LBR22_07395 [Desulfovibrio sp.]|jgi:predicted ATPase|nr:hypothetical protein [Desulfovibrio sp.]
MYDYTLSLSQEGNGYGFSKELLLAKTNANGSPKICINSCDEKLSSTGLKTKNTIHLKDESLNSRETLLSQAPIIHNITCAFQKYLSSYERYGNFGIHSQSHIRRPQKVKTTTS